MILESIKNIYLYLEHHIIQIKNQFLYPIKNQKKINQKNNSIINYIEKLLNTPSRLYLLILYFVSNFYQYYLIYVLSIIRSNNNI